VWVHSFTCHLSSDLYRCNVSAVLITIIYAKIIWQSLRFTRSSTYMFHWEKLESTKDFWIYWLVHNREHCTIYNSAIDGFVMQNFAQNSISIACHTESSKWVNSCRICKFYIYTIGLMHNLHHSAISAYLLNHDSQYSVYCYGRSDVTMMKYLNFDPASSTVTVYTFVCILVKFSEI